MIKLCGVGALLHTTLHPNSVWQWHARVATKTVRQCSAQCAVHGVATPEETYLLDQKINKTGNAWVVSSKTVRGLKKAAMPH